jgi:hypothetical protein
LGCVLDEEVARRTGRSLSAVMNRRYALGIPTANPEFRRWTSAEEKVLGTKPDREVASLLKRSVKSIIYRRLKLGIHPSDAHA